LTLAHLKKLLDFVDLNLQRAISLPAIKPPDASLT
jgi:hypothetical protein